MFKGAFWRGPCVGESPRQGTEYKTAGVSEISNLGWLYCGFPVSEKVRLGLALNWLPEPCGVTISQQNISNLSVDEPLLAFNSSPKVRLLSRARAGADRCQRQRVLLN